MFKTKRSNAVLPEGNFVPVDMSRVTSPPDFGPEAPQPVMEGIDSDLDDSQDVGSSYDQSDDVETPPVAKKGDVPEDYPKPRRVKTGKVADEDEDDTEAPKAKGFKAWLAERRRKKIASQARLHPCPVAHTHPNNHPGSPGSPKARRNKPWLYAVYSLWMLLAMAGLVAIVCIGHSRFSEFEYGEGWRGISFVSPYAAELEGDPTLVFNKITMGPWEDQYIDSNGIYEMQVHQGYRRSLLHKHKGHIKASYERLGKLMMGHTPTEIDTRGRALLAEEIDVPVADLPVLEGFVGQNLAGATSPEAYTPVSDIKTCTFKADASAQCVFEWKEVTRTDPTQPCYMIVRVVNPTDPDVSVAVHIETVQMGTFGLYKEWIALTIVGLVLLGIAFEVFHRMWVAFCGAFAMLGMLLIANMAPDLPTVMTWLDFGTLGLLFGMMIIVGQLQRTGVFEVLCGACLRGSKGNLLYLTLYITLITAFLSAWLDNVTTVLLMVPVTMAVFKAMNRNPVPLLMAQAMLSNVGGTMTMIGDPPNIIIGNELRNYIGFIDFIQNLAPGVLLAIPFCLLTLVLIFKKDLKGKVEGFNDVVTVVDQYKIKDFPLFWSSMYIVLGVVIGFLLHPIHHLNPAWIALVGATLLVLVVERQDAHAVLHAIEWDMLLFFAGMFIMVEGAMELGLIRKIAQFLTMIIDTAPPDSQLIAAIEVIIWFSAFFSAMLDNIPYTITMIPVIEQLAATNPVLDLPILAWALAFGACLGGNGTLIGASANIVTVGLAEKDGHHIGFIKWLLVGVPVMIVSVAVANVYMLVRYAI